MKSLLNNISLGTPIFLVLIIFSLVVTGSVLQAQPSKTEPSRKRSDNIKRLDLENLLFFLLIPAKSASFITNQLGRAIYPKGRLYRLPPYQSHKNPYWVPKVNGDGDRSAVEFDLGYHYAERGLSGLKTSGILRQSGGGSLDFSYVHYFKSGSSKDEKKDYFNLHSNVNLSPWRKIIWEVGFGFTSFDDRLRQKQYDGPSLKNSVTFFPFKPLALRTDYIYSPLDHNSLNDYEVGIYLFL